FDAGEPALVIQRVGDRALEQARHVEFGHSVLLADAAVARFMARMRVHVDQAWHYQQTTPVDALVGGALVPLPHESDGVAGKRHGTALEIGVAAARRIPRHHPVCVTDAYGSRHRVSS